MSVCLVLVCFTLVATRAIQIDTKLGPIKGITNDDSVHSFFNIPYAEPPIGKLRFQRTVPLQRATLSDGDYYDATEWGNSCVNPTLGRAMSNDTHPEFIEDCLYLNIFTNYNFDENTQYDRQELHPVMLWIHGGGMQMGTAATKIYEGSVLANDQNIVVVTINYRLGITGFFVDENGEGGANAFLDMIESLKFVQKHIESFGGDPNQITVAGESGGSWAVCGLVMSPLAKGLFQRSIQMSGSCINSIGGSWANARSTSMKGIRKIMKAINMTDFQDFYTIDMTELMDAAQMANLELGGIGPSMDRYVFPIPIEELLETGHVNGESVMIGTLIRESFSSFPFNMGYTVANESDLNAFHHKYFHDYQVKQIQETYPISEVRTNKIYKYGKSMFVEDAQLLQTQIETDCWVRCGSIKIAESIANNPITKNAVPAYFYQFGYFEEPYDLSNHGTDIGFLFGNGATSPFTAAFWNETMEEWAKVNMKFFGEYIKGIGPNLECGASASVQNGVYIEILDQIYFSDWSEIEVIGQRCKLYEDELRDDAWKNSVFCLGTVDLDETSMEEVIEMSDDFFESMKVDDDADTATENKKDL